MTTQETAASKGTAGTKGTKPGGEVPLTASTVAATAYPTTLAEAAARGENHRQESTVNTEHPATPSRSTPWPS